MTEQRVVRALVAVGMAAGLTLGAGGPVRAGQGTERKLVVTVLDASNKAVPGLTAADFGLKEDDKVREIKKADVSSDPLFVDVLVDTSTYLTRIVRETRDGLSLFVKELLAADARAQIALTEVGESAVRVENFTSKASTLDKSIQLIVAKPDQSVVFLDGLADAAKELQKQATARRVIIVFTIDESPDRSQTKSAEAVVRQSGAVVWGVSFRSATNNGGARDVVLDVATEKSGGTRLVVGVPTSIHIPFSMLADILSHQYVLTYDRPAGEDTPDAVQISVKRAGVRIYAPAWPPK
jgi:hypothetical protein